MTLQLVDLAHHSRNHEECIISRGNIAEDIKNYLNKNRLSLKFLKYINPYLPDIIEDYSLHNSTYFIWKNTFNTIDVQFKALLSDKEVKSLDFQKSIPEIIHDIKRLMNILYDKKSIQMTLWLETEDGINWLREKKFNRLGYD
jgi:hypothetical protein